MCSTTRAALLTGRNHHSVGVGCLANFDSGYPGYRGKISKEAGILPEMLRPYGYRNYMLGKWHVTPLTESGATGPFDGWPLGRGFDRFYGFLDAETDQYSPELVRDNTPVAAPGTYETGYHAGLDRSGHPLHRRPHGRRARHPLADLDRPGRLPRAAPGAARPYPEI
jgi:arylsulfatase